MWCWLRADVYCRNYNDNIAVGHYVYVNVFLCHTHFLNLLLGEIFLGIADGCPVVLCLVPPTFTQSQAIPWPHGIDILPASCMLTLVVLRLSSPQYGMYICGAPTSCYELMHCRSWVSLESSQFSSVSQSDHLTPLVCCSHAISRLCKRIMQSPNWLHNLEIGMHAVSKFWEYTVQSQYCTNF